MEKRYGALRTIGLIYKILGGIILALTVMTVIGICATALLGNVLPLGFVREFGMRPWTGILARGVVGAIIGSIIAILYGGGLGLTLFAFGEGIDLAISLEENTRLTATLLQRQQSQPPGSG